MWPFFWRKKQKANEDDAAYSESRKNPLTLNQMMEMIGDYEDLAENDVALKFWLPEPVEQAVKEVADSYSMTMSRLIRNFLIVHCYGLYVFEFINEEEPDFFREYSVMFSIGRAATPPGKIRVTTYWVPELGKNIRPVKIWVPLRLKGDLGLLAEHVELTTSNYVREIIIARFLGHGTLPMRPKMLACQPTQAAENWNEDQDVPWKEVTQEVFQKHIEREVKEEYIDDDSASDEESKSENHNKR